MNMKKKFDLNDFRGFFKAGNPSMMTAFDDIMTKKEAVQSPYILEEREMHVTQMDIFSRLMGERQVFFASEVDDYSASITIAQLLYLDSQSDTDITMYIMTGGGSCSAGLGICDTMNFIKSDIKTINVSMAASMGSLLLSSGTRGKRFSLPNASCLIHQPLIGGGGLSGPTADIMIEAKQMELLRERLFRYLAQRTGQPYEKIFEDARRDFWLNAEECKKYGIIDEIIETKMD
jgi:ATP-dependent Clp protease protease subunit